MRSFRELFVNSSIAKRLEKLGMIFGTIAYINKEDELVFHNEIIYTYNATKIEDLKYRAPLIEQVFDRFREYNFVININHDVANYNNFYQFKITYKGEVVNEGYGANFADVQEGALYEVLDFIEKNGITLE